MNTNGILRKHWFHVAVHFVTDALLFALSFVLAIVVRFGDEADGSLVTFWPSLAVTAVAFAAATYIAGLYSTHSASRGVFERAVLVGACLTFAVLGLIGITYGTFARPVGRGIVFLGASVAYVGIVIHHIFLLHALRNAKERVAYIVTSSFDEAETRLLTEFGGAGLQLVGLVTGCGYQPTGKQHVLGTIAELEEIVRRDKIDRVLCTNQNLGNATLTRSFCQLRYSGVSVMPLIILCEEVDQYVPLELVSHEWLLNASGEPHLFYIKKVKRLLDIIFSAVGLILGAPLVALGALAIKLTSPGPVFYRQVRSGRFGRTFHMTKLRTMCVDAEKNGAVWSSGKDPRVTWVGSFLRKYRIDEIPQLWHVLCGHMSFVGPRPERPEIIEQLAREIPFYEERLMVQPGITGWAQVSYPYGASVLDARRKLEYDLYYMKHMSVFLDVFILLDTVRTILGGGARVAAKRTSLQSETILEWERLKAKEASSVGEFKLGAA